MLLTIFEKALALYPDQICLKFEREPARTYAQVDLQANQLAHSLLAHGVKPKDFVGYKGPRSADQVIIFLALLKINAVYVPISSEQLPARIQLILSVCRAKHIIIGSPLSKEEETACREAGAAIFPLFNLKSSIIQQKKTKPDIVSSEKDLVYVIHSGGTTGPSKAIPITNAGMQGYWEPELRRQIKHPVKHVLASLSRAFDAHVWEYMMAWTFGACLHITDETTRKDIARLSGFIIDHHISDMTLTPAILQLFDYNQLRRFTNSGLKAIYSTGEACTEKIVRLFSESNIAIFNCYGPTEATFGLSMTLCKLEDFHQGRAPIGFPPQDSPVKIKIINEQGKEVADGEQGQLQIISPYITPGYLNVDQNDNFRADAKGELIRYKTGDIFEKHGRYLYYIGRYDPHYSQLKIRGQLVNPMVVEELLKKHPDISNACVVVKNGINEGNEDFLIAYLTPKKPLTIGELRQYCKNSALSSAYIPAFFISETALPLTISGKIDRNKLSEKRVIFNRSQLGLPYVPHTKRLEDQLINIWKDVINFKFTSKEFSLGIEDPLEYVGGNSINIMMFLAAVNKAYGVNIGR